MEIVYSLSAIDGGITVSAMSEQDAECSRCHAEGSDIEADGLCPSCHIYLEGDAYVPTVHDGSEASR